MARLSTAFPFAFDEHAGDEDPTIEASMDNALERGACGSPDPPGFRLTPCSP